MGTFSVRLVAPVAATDAAPEREGYTAITGKVYDAPVPEEVVWDLDAEQGGCQLLKPRVPFCDPACVDGVCVEEDTCKPSAKGISAGALTFTGLMTKSGATMVTVDPIGTSYSTPGDVSLPYPAFDEGSELKLSASGAAFPEFSLSTKGIAPLSLTTDSFPLIKGSALMLTWKAASDPEASRIRVKLDISHHGGTKGKIVCDVSDDGSLSVAASLIDKLLALGVAGYPTIVITRVSSATGETRAGAILLEVTSELERGVTIDGLTSCNDDTDCLDGKTCQSDLTCK